MQSTLKKSLFLFSALMACASSLSTASYQAKPLSCRADNSMERATDSVASMRLGKKYEFGEGVNQDNSQAFEWYCNAAMQNNAEGQLKIALFLLEGKGKQRDVSNGLAWLNRAANNGSHDAELALGILLVDTDAIRSAVLFKRAAAGGNLYANHRLAELYYYGMGVPQNYHKAQELSEIGVAAGFEKSKQLLIRIQVKQASGAFQPDQTVSTVEPAVNNITQPKLRKELQPEWQPELQPELQSELPEYSQDEPPSTPQKSRTLLQHFLSILPSLPSSDASDNDNPVSSDVIVTTSKAVAVGAQAEEQQHSSTSASIRVSEHEVSVVDASVSGGLASEVRKGEPKSRLAGVHQQILEKQLATVAKGTVELENEQVSAVVKSVVPKKTVLTTVEESPSLQGYARDAGWINQQPDMHYSIQLVQTTQLEGIFKYIKNHDFDNNIYYIHAQQGGEYRYILLYGNYPNNQMSKVVAKTLPAAVQKAGYWIRTFGDLRRSYVISP